MRTLFLYTLNTIRSNRRTSLSIMVSILLASTLLCAMCTFVYTQLGWQTEIEEYESGQWHGELGGEISPRMLETVDNNLYVEATMVKGPYTCLRLSQESPLPYLLLRDADENYWRLMGEKNTITQGRIPQKPGEIAVSKSFFERNPEYQLGDTLTLPAGSRWLDGQALDAVQVRKEGESFYQTGEISVTLVGEMDLTTNTTVPGYYAMGYMDRESLTGQEELVVYVKFRDIRRTYEIMPKIADALGIQKDEYGRYENHFGYHGRLLACHFVFPPGMALSLENMGVILVYVALVLLIMGAFVMIICGAFQVSATARCKQLGMFRSIGATPGQIAASILMEGVILSVVPILLSLGIGYGFTVAVMRIYTDIAGELLYFPVTVRFSPLVALLAAMLSFLTALASAFFPALKISRLSPLEAIRMQENARGHKRRGKVHSGRREIRYRHRMVRERSGSGYWLAALPGMTGFERTLAGASHRANRRGFRAGVLSLTFCLMLVAGFFSFMGLNDFLTARNQSAEEFNIYVRLDMAAETDRELLGQLQSIPGEEESVYYCVARMACQVSPQEETAAFQEQGGFAGLDLDKWAMVNRDGKYRTRVYLFGMQEERFDEYCRQLGEDPAGFYDTEEVRAVALSCAPVYPDVVNNPAKSALSYSHLKLSKGQVLTIEEKTEDAMNTDCVFPVEVGAVAEEVPRLGDTRNNYTINLYVPLSVYYSVLEGLSEEKVDRYYTYVKVRTTPENDLAVTEQIMELCESVMASEDVFVTSTAAEKADNAVSARAMGAVVDCIGVLLGLIGVANTLSAVSHTMMRRRREFAMLRSVGMDSRGVGKLLSLESFRMAVTPVMISLSSVALLLQLLMWVVEVSWRDFLPWIPWGKLLLSVGLVMAAVVVSYRACADKIRRDTIIDAIRDENM